MDIESQLSNCRATDEELTELIATIDKTQLGTAKAKEVKSKLAKHIFKVMEMVDVKMSNALEFKELKRQNA